ncbi:mechanosensitive ion channel family protein [Gelidibacter maritimus]|uniref:Mechanosensitive ion channel family protein n=1 Tax=Gelidibacter maritimus TaxID=2761487 RepID=A0A7W2M5L4_9FLAO|nr:mechanosensitive ion channel family protein [Gelidibacter maritimus]MBA6153143.1 mechanosensitive ion channel family protein [Gelidibacter maritimus]
MREYFKIHNSDLIYGGIVVATTVILYLLTIVIHKWIVQRRRKKLPGRNIAPMNRIKNVLIVLWMILGAMALSFIFIEEDQYEALTNHFKLVLYLAFVIILTIIAATFVGSRIKKSLAKKVHNKEDITSLKFLRYVAVIGIYFTGILFCLLAIPSLHAVAQTALGGAGIIALVVGISSQEALSNLIGGFFIIAFKPFKVGDIIKLNDTQIGKVADITLRHTVIRTFTNRMIVIPNSIINKEKLVNYDLIESKCCEYVEMGISYDSDVGLAKKIMQEECARHPLIIDNRSAADKQEGKPKIRIAVVELEDSAVVIRVWAWAKNYSDSIAVKRDLFESIKERFEAEGIEIPYPYRSIVIKNPGESSPEAAVPP